MKLKKGIEDRYGNFITIDTLIQNSKYNFVNPEWGFPKGRKNIKESNIECALREFNEETRKAPNTADAIDQLWRFLQPPPSIYKLRESPNKYYSNKIVLS